MKSTAPLTPATTLRREGAPYSPTGPVTGLPLALTQNFQSAGAGGQDGSGRQVLGGSQLRRGGVGQLGGTTNRFTKPPRRRQNPDQASGPGRSRPADAGKQTVRNRHELTPRK